MANRSPAAKGSRRPPGAKAGTKAAGRAAAEAPAGRTPVKRFRAPLKRREGGSACSIDIPFDVEKTFGARGRVPVRGTLNGAAFRSSVFRMGGDCHFMVVNRQLREAAGVSGGETVSVVLERDTEPRVVEPPADFARALEGNGAARAAWDRLSYTHRREHVRHIEEAKRPETRLRRIEKSVETLAAGRKEAR